MQRAHVMRYKAPRKPNRQEDYRTVNEQGDRKDKKPSRDKRDNRFNTQKVQGDQEAHRAQGTLRRKDHKR